MEGLGMTDDDLKELSESYGDPEEILVRALRGDKEENDLSRTDLLRLLLCKVRAEDAFWHWKVDEVEADRDVWYNITEAQETLIRDLTDYAQATKEEWDELCQRRDNLLVERRQQELVTR